MGCGLNKNANHKKLRESVVTVNDNLALEEILLSGQVWKGSQLYVFAKYQNNDLIILRFDSNQEEWEQLQINQSHIQIYEHSQAIFIDNEFILITGGRKEENQKQVVNDTCYIYSTTKNIFFNFPLLNLARYQHCIAFYDENAYVIGGRTEDNDGNDVTSSVEKIFIPPIREFFFELIQEEVPDTTKQLPQSRCWAEVEPFLKYRYEMSHFVYQKEIYIIGGIDRNQKLCRHIEKYNPLENHWYLLKWKLPFAIHSTSITAINDKEILFIGGKNDAGMIPSIYEMNMENRKYHSKGAFSFRIKPKILHYEDDVYIFGGDKDMSCEKLNPIEFISYAANESYTTFINDDLTGFPGSNRSVVIGSESQPKLANEQNVLQNLNVVKNESIDKFYFLGTPNHLFFLEFELSQEKVVTHSISFDYRAFYFGFGIRLGQDHILSLGGVTPPIKKASKNVQAINLTTMQAAKLPKMTVPRCKFQGCILDKKVYVFGGINFSNDEEQYLKECECYDFTTEKWTSIAPLNIQRYNYSCCVGNNNLIYLFGGHNGQETQNTIEVYDPAKNTWTISNTHMYSQPVQMQTVHHLGDAQFLSIGGFNNEKQLSEIYLIKENECKILGYLQTPRSNHKMVLYQDKLIIIGGCKEENDQQKGGNEANESPLIESINIDKLLSQQNKDENTFNSQQFPQFEENIYKYYRDKMLQGIASS